MTSALEAGPASLSLPAPPSEAYEHFYLVVQAAACGLGLAIVPRLLVELKIAAGHLVAPLVELWTADHRRDSVDVQASLSWLRLAIGDHSFPPAPHSAQISGVG